MGGPSVYQPSQKAETKTTDPRTRRSRLELNGCSSAQS